MLTALTTHINITTYIHNLYTHNIVVVLMLFCQTIICSLNIRYSWNINTTTTTTTTTSTPVYRSTNCISDPAVENHLLSAKLELVPEHAKYFRVDKISDLKYLNVNNNLYGKDVYVNLDNKIFNQNWTFLFTNTQYHYQVGNSSAHPYEYRSVGACCTDTMQCGPNECDTTTKKCVLPPTTGCVN